MLVGLKCGSLLVQRGCWGESMTYSPTPKITWVARGARQRVSILNQSATAVIQRWGLSGRTSGFETLKGEADRVGEGRGESRRRKRRRREGSGGSMDGIVASCRWLRMCLTWT